MVTYYAQYYITHTHRDNILEKKISLNWKNAILQHETLHLLKFNSKPSCLQTSHFSVRNSNPERAKKPTLSRRVHTQIGFTTAAVPQAASLLYFANRPEPLSGSALQMVPCRGPRPGQWNGIIIIIIIMNKIIKKKYPTLSTYFRLFSGVLKRPPCWSTPWLSSVEHEVFLPLVLHPNIRRSEWILSENASSLTALHRRSRSSTTCNPRGRHHNREVALVLYSLYSNLWILLIILILLICRQSQLAKLQSQSISLDCFRNHNNSHSIHQHKISTQHHNTLWIQKPASSNERRSFTIRKGTRLSQRSQRFQNAQKVDKSYTEAMRIHAKLTSYRR